MSVLDLATWVQLISSLAVLGTLFYLAIEIRQNTEAMHAQTRQAVMSSSQAELFHLAANPEVNGTMVSAEPLSQNEYVRLHAWLAALLRAREFSWLQFRKGIIDKDLWETEKVVIAINLSPRRARNWWDRVGRNAYSPEFVVFVDALIADNSTRGVLEQTLNWEQA